MRVMITGGTGFVGYHTAQALIDAGHDVCLLVRSEDKAKKLYGDATPDCVSGDIIDAASVAEAMHGCDAAIHSAAMVSTAAKDADRVYDTNVNGTRLVFETALQKGVKQMVHVSSVTALFNPRASVLDGNSPPGTARNAYGRSKVACEKYVRTLQSRGKPITITYPASVIGPDDPGLTEPHQGLQVFLTQFAPVMPSGNQFVDVRDVAEVHLRILQRGLGGGRYPLGGHYLPWRDLGPMLEELTGKEVRKFPATGRVMRGLGLVVDLVKRVKPMELPMGYEAMVYATKWVQLDNSQAEQDLDFSFRPLEDSLVDAIQWMVRAGHLSAEDVGRLAP